MKSTAAIILAMLAMAAHAQQAMYWDGATRIGPRPLPENATATLDGTATISNPRSATWDQLAGCGWYPITRATVPDGEHLLSSTWPDMPPFIEQITTMDSAEYAAAEIVRRNTPVVYDAPIEVSVLILSTETDSPMGIAVASYVDEDGLHLVLYEGHASPMPPPAESEARRDAAIAADKLARKTAKAELDALKANVKALKAEKEPKP